MRERVWAPVTNEEGRVSETRETHTYEWREVESPLEAPNGNHADIKVAISEQDGELRGTNFWDLDKTLLIAEPIHAKAVEQIFLEFAQTEKARAELHRIYFAGFALGNSFREWDRMYRIYGEGQKQYEDPSVYENEFMGADNPKQKLIDEPGHAERYHERANEILQRYGKIAYGIMKEAYEKDPEEFQKDFVKPETMQLIKALTRLGQANVYMTANQKDFATGLVTFSGLSEYGLGLATDETMAGGGKEIAIEKLIEQLASMGLKVNRKRSTAIGDSIKGDVGSGAKAGLGNGVFITQTSAEVAALLKRAGGDSKDSEQVRGVLEGTSVEAIPTEEVAKSAHGVYRFGKRSSKQEKEK